MLQVGDRVKISPIITSCPWMGKPTGKILFIDEYGTVAVEVEGEKLGHSCSICSSGEVMADNGWWFEQKELELIKEI